MGVRRIFAYPGVIFNALARISFWFEALPYRGAVVADPKNALDDKKNKLISNGAFLLPREMLRLFFRFFITSLKMVLYKKFSSIQVKQEKIIEKSAKSTKKHGEKGEMY